MAAPDPLALPRDGDPIDPHGDYAYVTRTSASRQADHWNRALSNDPVLGPDSGFVVGVGPRRDGRYPLIWVRATTPV